MKHPDKLPKPLSRQLFHFFENHPPQAFSNSLRDLLLDYMEKQVSTGLPLHFNRFLSSLSDFFEVLDTVSRQQQKRKRRRRKEVKDKE